MVFTKTGDLFKSEAQTLVNTVNCVGVMGKGVALAFKERFPEMFAEYVRLCAANRVRLGEPYVYKQLAGPWVLNFPTKDHWRSVSRLADIVQGLKYLEEHYKAWGITSLAVPPLGCGQGGLEWRVVGPTLYRFLDRLDIPVELYAPHGTKPSEMTREFLSSPPSDESSNAWDTATPSRIPASWLALVEIVHRVVSEPYHWPVGRVTFQKMAYFATEAGVPTGLTFTKGSYGPFSSDLKPMTSKLVNNGLMIETPVGKMINVAPGPTFTDAKRTMGAELQKFEKEVDAVADLFMRVRTQQAEIAASVVFAARSLLQSDAHELTEGDVVHSVMQWKVRRTPPLDPKEVARTVRHLNMLQWVSLAPSELPVSPEAC